ncbi:MAG: hypothetical protein NTZ46_05825, partial [Verrucomicrobia bacterium]|nr:hypothetical protein [Verrucomicrobiota bacterium]
AILDSNSRKIVSSPAQIGDPLADAVEGTPIAKTWMAALSDLTTFAQTGGIPKAAAGQIRIYQRCFYLNSK